ncbi:uncharacterized protein N7511_002871 [Penicillium nucicola]|uniref:uncharacterized protein n=1 Tax=Penicillium nucicola TaxID=1850975 RepID=UPI0025450756|nr:uncharacterized protein N7511_002871 [Penicillium nucicola]KAJ5770820.1 hypothetical protein N7511_002871 [Penicillium nucicola]
MSSFANEVFPAVQYDQLTWDSIATAWPTGIVTADYSCHQQNWSEQVTHLGLGKPVILDSQLLGLSSSWDLTSQPDSWNCFVPNSQAQDPNHAVQDDDKRHDVSNPQIFKRGEELRSTEIFAQGWPDQASDTVCGWGSSEQHTRLVRTKLAELLKTYHVGKLNDAGCGDLAWMSLIDLEGIDYVGYDVHERANWAELQQRGYHLDVLDITANESRPADLVICRDVFIHLPNDMIFPTLERFRRSASLLLTTSYTNDSVVSGNNFSNFKRMDKPSLQHRKLDLTLAPFNLGQPLVRIPEDSPNKYLGLWDISHSSLPTDN